MADRNHMMGTPREVTVRRERRKSRTEFRLSVGEPGRSESFVFELPDQAVTRLISLLQELGPYTASPTSPNARGRRYRHLLVVDDGKK